MTLYNKGGNSSLRKHVVTNHTRIFSHFFSYMDGRTKIVACEYASYLKGSVENPLSRRKMPNYESSCTIAMTNFFVRKNLGS